MNNNNRIFSNAIRNHFTRMRNLYNMNFNPSNFNNAEQVRLLNRSIMSSNIRRALPLPEHGQTDLGTSSMIDLEMSSEERNPVQSSSENYTINIEDPTPIETRLDQSIHDHRHNRIADAEDVINNSQETVDGNGENVSSAYQGPFIPYAEDHETFISSTSFKYFPYCFLLIIKILIDYRLTVMNIAILYFTFATANKHLKREIAKRQDANRMYLLFIICYVSACIVFVTYVFDTQIFFVSVNGTVLQLLCSLAATNLVSKLIVIIFKTTLTCLPRWILPYQKKRTAYLITESVSQFCCSLVPLKTWAEYFSIYHSQECNMWDIVLVLMYFMLKMSETIYSFTLLLTAIRKSMRMSKESVTEPGEICAICHEEYFAPMKLGCGHIFCESCILSWLDIHNTCPICRRKTAVPETKLSYRTGHTTHLLQLF